MAATQKVVPGWTDVNTKCRNFGSRLHEKNLENVLLVATVLSYFCMTKLFQKNVFKQIGGSTMWKMTGVFWPQERKNTCWIGSRKRHLLIDACSYYSYLDVEAQTSRYQIPAAWILHAGRNIRGSKELW